MPASAVNGRARSRGRRTSELLRFATAGSVDDGKSTLIGRLLYDARSILADQLAAVRAASQRRNGNGALDLALLTDGLRAEREQGITIDVAYRYFQTPRRKFIIADTPGHEQYTRNMVTGASTADLAVVLLDARHGVVGQSRRHAVIASLLGIPHLVVCVNKMDLIDFDEDAYDALVEEFADFAARLDVHDLTFIPVSALHGDNVVDRSTAMPWYEGPSLLHHLEHVHIASDRNLADVRFPVQWVIRPGPDSEDPDYRGYAGQVASGVLEPGAEVVVQPSGLRTRIAAIDTLDGPRERAFPPMSVTLRLADDLDVARGDVICGVHDSTQPTRDLGATVCWMADAPLAPGDRYAIKHTTCSARVVVEAVDHRLDVETLERDESAGELRLNDIGHVLLRASQPLVADPYAHNRTTGAFILIEESSNETVGAGMVAAAA
jgi:sulfate adenylyltransferase large subunit